MICETISVAKIKLALVSIVYLCAITDCWKCERFLSLTKEGCQKLLSGFFSTKGVAWCPPTPLAENHFGKHPLVKIPSEKFPT